MDVGARWEGAEALQTPGDDICGLSRCHAQFLEAFCFVGEKQRLREGKAGIH